MPNYVLLLRIYSDSDFVVTFPDFPGCVAHGSSHSEVWERARAAIEVHIQALLQGGAVFPDPSTLDAVRADPANADANVYAVTWPSDIHRRLARPDEDRKIAEILRAVAAAELKTHPIYEAIKARNGGQWVGLDDHGIYTDADSVTLTGDRFTVSGNIGYSSTCPRRNDDVPDVEWVLVSGRFIDGRPVIENIAQECPP